MDDPREHALVVKALTDNLSGYVRWKNARLVAEVNGNSDLKGLTSVEIRRLLVEFVRRGGRIEQKVETREEHRDHFDYFYYAVIPHELFRYGLFVELVMIDDDEEVPIVQLVSVHPEYK